MIMMMVTLTCVVDDDVYLENCGVDDDDDDAIKIFTWSTRASSSDRITGGSVIAGASMPA